MNPHGLPAIISYHVSYNGLLLFWLHFFLKDLVEAHKRPNNIFVRDHFL